MVPLLTTELNWLAATAIMTSTFWVPYIANRMAERGIWNALYEPHGDTGARAAWAERMMRAHANAVENLVIFAPLVLLLHVQGVSTPLTEGACAVFFCARAAHFVVFSLGIPLLRVVAFLTGFACQMALALALLGLV